MEYQERLRSMALSDDRFVASVLGMGQDTIEASGLDPKTHAMVRLAALAGRRRRAELLQRERRARARLGSEP